MTARVVIFDLSGTIVSPLGVVVPGIPETFQALRDMGLKIAVSSNSSAYAVTSQLRALGLTVDFIAAKDIVGVKGTKVHCQQIADYFGCDVPNMVYVGDNDRTDFRNCVNSGVLYLSARWADPTAMYGIPASDPDSVRRFVARHLMEEPAWYWRLEQTDSLNRPIDARSLVPSRRNDVDVLKRDYVLKVATVDYFKFLFRRVIASLYLEGRLAEYDFITFYPGHAGSKKGSRYSNILDTAGKVFRVKYVEDLLVRHAPAEKSVYVRTSGGTPMFTTQMNTMHVNPAYRRKLREARVLMLDDFCTDGNAFECSRNLLLRAGAAKVDCVSVGRYGSNYIERIPDVNLVWDPYAPHTFKEADFKAKARAGIIEQSALAQHDRQLAIR